MTVGNLILRMIAELETRGIPSVYLRNYEKLPSEIGNDVDLLVPQGKRRIVFEILSEVASKHKWIYLKRTNFSPLAVYFANPETTEILHLDLFDRIEWHFLEFAFASQILANRRFNGLVYIPSAQDEIFLNLSTRLIYQGKIRDCHQIQARNHVQELGEASLIQTFSRHLGRSGESIAKSLLTHHWKPSSDIRKSILLAATITHGLKDPRKILIGATRYLWRTLQKIIRPPGTFLVIEGADGVGKSTVLKELIPWCSKWSAGRTTHDLTWPPTRIEKSPEQPEFSTTSQKVSHNVTLKRIPGLLVFLMGFWWRWFYRIRPLLSMSHCVVATCYSYDIFLNPSKLHVNLPPALTKLLSSLTPRPNLTFALVADPALMHARKPAIPLNNISIYQQRWQSLAKGKSNMISVSAEGSAEEISLRVKQAILRALTSHGV